MKWYLTVLLGCFLQVAALAQLQGDRLLQLIGKPVTDQLFLELKEQETFYTNNWDSRFTIYIGVTNEMIKEVELENGKLRYGSSTERYGYYNKELPLGLSWKMDKAGLASVLGNPSYTSSSMNYCDYETNGWKVRIFFENSHPVSISYTKSDNIAFKPPVAAQPPISKLPGNGKALVAWLKVDTKNATAKLDWNALRQLIEANGNLKPFAGTDSVDYIGQVYYSTPYKVDGFNRSAMKRRKAQGDWYYEAFYDLPVDSNLARDIFFAVYDEMKDKIKANSADDFILAAVAKKPISVSPVNWMAQWTLSKYYKTLAPGLTDVKIGFMVSGMKNAFKNDQMEYTFKVYISKKEIPWDIFRWDKPL